MLLNFNLLAVLSFTTFGCFFSGSSTTSSNIKISLLLRKSVVSFVSSICLLNSGPCMVLDSRASYYDFFHDKYDQLNGEKDVSPAIILGIDKIRDAASTFVTGNVLEIAVGTGLQLPHYEWSKIKSFVGVDESEGMMFEANKRLATLPVTVSRKLQYMDASKINFPTSNFDTVVDTFSFCVFSDPQSVINEMVRVVKPEGRIVLLENSRSDNIFVAIYQDLTEPILTPVSKGCKWNVDVTDLATKAGLLSVSEQRFDLGTILLGVYEKKL